MSLDTKTLNSLRIDRANAPKRRPPYGLILGLLVVVGAAGGAAWWFNRPKPAVVRTIVVQETKTGGERTLLNASGYVTARREATVSSKITGKVVAVLLEEGMKVEAGQVLARLDSSNVEKEFRLAQAQVNASKAALGETKANLVQAEREVNRLVRLERDQAATQIEVDRAQTEVMSLQARLERQTTEISVSEQQLALWQQHLDDTVIRAPFGGVVTAKNAQPGEMISPMSVGGFTRTGICTIVDMSSLEIEVDVSESYINRVGAGRPVEATLDAYPNWQIPAKVIAIIPTADRQKATVKVRVGFEKLDPRILPEMSVKVAFQSAGGSETKPAQRNVTIAKSAVRQRDGRDIVWLVRDGRIERRAVTVGETLGDQVTIVAGVGGGDRVVVDGPENLAEGVSVTEIKK